MNKPILLFATALSFTFISCIQPKNKSDVKSTTTETQAATTQTPEASGQPPVLVNGVALTAQQLQVFQKTYGIIPKPGDYWYDRVSGLYGMMGYPALGFLYAGHDFAPLASNVSNGNTGVFINGRQLPQSEWLLLSQIIGAYVQQGRYWLNSQGFAGYEGNPNPTLNLFLLAQQNNFQGGNSNNGDNFWSSRFSAGNSSGNSGYVSVPGYGPVGYGD